MIQPSLFDPLWKEIPGEPNYCAHPSGWIKSCLGRWGRHRFLKPRDGINGYKRVALSGQRSHTIHRLVLKTFIPNPENKETVNHKNGIKDDNRVENLEWCTVKENIRHKYEVLGYKQATRKFSEDDILDIRAVRFLGATYKEICAAFNAGKSTISRIVNGESYLEI